MNSFQLQQVADGQFSDCLTEMMRKVPDYSGEDQSGDTLGNFKNAAETAGVTKFQAWLVFFRKHGMAIEKFCRTGVVTSEPIEGRITDAINYLVFLRAMVKEERYGGRPLQDKGGQ